MSEIEVGEYIRTKYGNIEKVKHISKFDDGDIHINTMRGAIYYRPREITKHSKSIIDLIEEGDFVNDIRVSQSYLDNIKYLAKEIVEKNYGIKTILTHEQYEQNCYKVGDIE